MKLPKVGHANSVVSIIVTQLEEKGTVQTRSKVGTEHETRTEAKEEKEEKDGNGGQELSIVACLVQEVLLKIVCVDKGLC